MRVILAFLALLSFASDALAERRYGFVVGIDAYDRLGADAQLKKARSDARAIRTALVGLGYSVAIIEDATRSEFNDAWQDFISKVEAGDTVVVYFAGHGVEVSGQNFLVPRDVPAIRPGRDEQLKRESISFQELMADLAERKAGLRLFVIDACRENPFGKVAGRSLSLPKGLSVAEPPPEGTFVMYSAGAGQTALDRLNDEDTNPNSVYTRSLLPLLNRPGTGLTDLAKEVQTKVRDLAATVDHQQTPAYYDQVVGRMCLAGGDCSGSAKFAALPPVFGFDRDGRLSREGIAQLRRLLPEISSDRVQRIVVNGHTDERTPTYNMNLSLRMATEVASFLTQSGVRGKITTRSWGATKPVKEKGNPYNQRVEIELE